VRIIASDHRRYPGIIVKVHQQGPIILADRPQDEASLSKHDGADVWVIRDVDRLPPVLYWSQLRVP
jgi:hypothetical protein